MLHFLFHFFRILVNLVASPHLSSDLFPLVGRKRKYFISKFFKLGRQISLSPLHFVYLLLADIL